MDRETALMLAVKEGSSEAFRELYGLYEKPLASFLHRLCWNRSLVEDLLQEVMLRVWRAAATYEPKARVSTWIFRIAHNLWINESAKRKAEPLGNADPAGAADPSGGMARGELQQAVRRAIESLPEAERECLVLSEYNGMKYAEIAEVMGIPVGTVKSRIFTASQRLRESLKGLNPGG